MGKNWKSQSESSNFEISAILISIPIFALLNEDDSIYLGSLPITRFGQKSTFDWTCPSGANFSLNRESLIRNTWFQPASNCSLDRRVTKSKVDCIELLWLVKYFVCCFAYNIKNSSFHSAIYCFHSSTILLRNRAPTPNCTMEKSIKALSINRIMGGFPVMLIRFVYSENFSINGFINFEPAQRITLKSALIENSSCS